MPRKKPKKNTAASPDESLVQDRCETPAYALEPLLPYLRQFKRGVVWESACGTGRIVRLLKTQGHTVHGTDLLYGTNFFHLQAQGHVQVTNPPYSCKVNWIEYSYALGIPFALLVPLETIGLGSVQKMMEEHGAELLLLDKRVDFIMPNIGEIGSSANFPVLWYCWKMLPAPIIYGKITKRPEGQMQIFDLPAVIDDSLWKDEHAAMETMQQLTIE